MDIYKYVSKGIIFILFLFFLCDDKLFAQQYSIYQSITTANGLPSNYVFAVCEDENGFLWAGTDKGLCKYNGFSWQVWDKDNGLPGNYITSLSSDKKGGLWLDISNKGTLYFDIATGKIHKTQPNVYTSDQYSNIYFTTSSEKKGIHQVFVIEEGIPIPHKIYEYKPDINFIIRTDAKAKKVICFMLPGFNLNKQDLHYKGDWSFTYIALPVRETVEAFYVSNDYIVITTSHYYRFSREGKLLKSYTLFKNNTYSYSCFTKNGYYISDDKTGYYFISNRDEISFFDSKNGLGSDFVNRIYEMKDGTIVFATLGSGLQFVKNNYRKSYSTGNRVVRSIVKSGNIWYALAGDKVFSINQTTSFLTDLGTVQNSALNLFKANDQILIGSLKGIDFYKLQPILYHNRFISYNAGISSVLQTKNGFIAFTYGNRLLTFNSKDTSTTAAPMHIIEKALPLANGYATLSYEEGLVLTDTVQHTNIHLTQKDGLLSNSIQSVHEYKDTLWISSKAGVNIYTNGHVVKTISYNQGFAGSKAMYCFHDNKQLLWVVSDKYLHLYDGNKLKAITSHPLVSDNEDLLNTAAYDSVTNTLATGSIKNISIIFLANILPNTAVTIPRMLQVIVDGKIQESSNFNVPYQFENITFSLAPYASSPLSSGTFFYELEGNDETWGKLKDSLSFSYAALRSGRYKLKAKIINADGYESNERILATFVVGKPFWESGWFYLLLLMVTIFFTTLIVKRFETLRRRKRDAQLLMQQTLQNERERISKDLHDHLGSNLVTIVAQVDNIETKLNNNKFSEASNTVQHLSNQTRQVMNVLRETIWAVQENEHSLDEFVIRMRTFLQRFYESSGITWQLKVLQDDEIKLSPKQTLQLFRILQELSQNIIKHSKASEANYFFYADKKSLEIVIYDNGIGLKEEAKNNNSNGLANMKQRVQELNGNILFETKIGTVIKIEIPLSF